MLQKKIVHYVIFYLKFFLKMFFILNNIDIIIEQEISSITLIKIFIIIIFL